MRKVLIGIIAIIISILSIECVVNYQRKREMAISKPEQAIESYFKYYNKKDVDGVLSTLSDTMREERCGKNVKWGFEYLDYEKIVKIAKIEEKENWVKYNVIYESKYTTEDTGEPWKSGVHTIDFYLVRKDKKSPWLINEIGVC